jgi:PAS domain S-box-containing protein
MSASSACIGSSGTLNSILETALDAVIIMRPDGIVAGWNSHAEAIFGWSSSEAIGLPLSELIIPPVHREAHSMGLRRYLETGAGPVLQRRIEISALHKAGHELLVELSITPSDQDGESVFIGFLRDISDRKHAELALRESEARFRMLAEILPQLVWTARPDGYTDWYNDRWYEFTGFPRGQFGDQSWEPILHPDDLEMCREIWRNSVLTGEPYEIEYRFLDRKTGGYRWHLGRAVPQRSPEGNIVRWFGTCTDIHDLRVTQEELREREQQLQRINETLEARVEERTREREVALNQLHAAQKLETLGQLTGGVAHDFNNLLTPIMGSLDLLSRRSSEGDDRSRRWIETGLQATSRAATLVQRLLAFARRQDLQPRAVDVVAVLDEVEDLITRSIGPTIEVIMQHDRSVPAARIDPNQLEMAVLNLALNARDAMPNGGKLTIRVSHDRIMEADAELGPGEYVRIDVIDTGTGMDAQTLRRAIEPFFTTRGVGKGTGLGLSMVHGLAAQSGGALRLSSSLGAGTTATLWLPVADKAAISTQSLEATAPAAGDGKTLLLVDDDEMVRMSTAEMLADLGYSVIQASSGIEALDLARARKAAIDMLVTDFLMPGMNGVELAGAFKSIAPQVPVLLVTGYANIAEGAGAELPRVMKPFSQSRIAARVAELLGTPDDLRLLSAD